MGRINLWDVLWGKRDVKGGLKISKNKNEDIYLFAHSLKLSVKPKEKPEIEYIKIDDLKEPKFKQELIYNGCSSDNIKFLYREFTENMIRAPFNQEVQYDLNEGKIIGFKGVRIEIIEATNIQLKYKVLKSFPEYE